MSCRSYIYTFILAILVPSAVMGQQKTFTPTYPFLHSGSEVQDKNFYVLTLLEQLPEVSTLLAEDPYLEHLRQEQIDSLQDIVSRCHYAIGCSVHPYYWSDRLVHESGARMLRLLERHPAVYGNLMDNMRASGYFYRFHNLPDSAMFMRSWEDACKGITYIIQAYTTNQDLIYPQIDSTTFPVTSIHYKVLVAETIQMLDHRKQHLHEFFEPSLKLALGLLFDNYRDEAARFEPLDSTNEASYRLVRHIHWDAYPYSVIMIPGEGPENNRNISIMGMHRCELGAEQYRAGKAPFIVVSGGYVHPFQTPYCEADQMKKYLVDQLGIPASAVILEPHARHTTTNIRNTNRILYRQGFPVDKPVLCTSTPTQIDYILETSFSDRNQQYLKYVPYSRIKRLDAFNLEYYPVKASLQMDAIDPLDP